MNSTNSSKRFLIAFDTSQASEHALSYVGELVGGRQDVHLLLLHVAEPLPAVLLEFGGRDTHIEEDRAEAELLAEQTAWIQKEKKAARPAFARARAILREAGFRRNLYARLVTPVAGESLDSVILDAAREESCGTIVVGYEAFSWLKGLVRRHVAEALLEKAKGLAIWVVRSAL